jgi:hypothetical protein
MERGFGLLLGDLDGDINIEGIVLINVLFPASREQKRASGREIA